MFDILSVVFRDELPVLRVQAQSINLYCRDIGIKNIFVVVNDTDDVAKEIDANWYGDLSNCVKIIPRSKLGSHFHDDGWMSQQYLKLKGSTLSNNTWVMVLDAKSIIVKKLYLNKFFDIFGRIKAGWQKLPPGSHNIEKNVNQLFNIKLHGDTGQIPYLFRVDLVTDLIKHVELKTNTPFDIWFKTFQSCHITESALYTGYVQSRYTALWKYSRAKRYVRSVCIGRSHNDIVNTLFDKELFKNCYYVVMIHRHVWDNLNIEQKEKYKKFLISRGLSSVENLK